MITVALITTRFLRQGPNKQLLYLIRSIDRNKVKPIIITLSPERDPSLLEEFKKENVEIIQLNLSFWESLLKGRKIINKLILKRNIQIIHSFTYAIRCEFVTFKAYKAKKIATIRNSPKQSSSGYFGKILGIIFYLLKKMMYNHFDQIVACSKSIGELSELITYNKVVIQNGIEIAKISNLIIDKTQLKESLNLPKDKAIFLTISNGTIIKNIEFLLNYFSTNSNKFLIVAGDIKDNYLQITRNNQNFLFTGHIDKIQDYYQAADFFISASYLEGLPNSVLESLSLGTPCILSDIPMHREIIEQSPNLIGQLFQNNSFSDLNEKIEAFEKKVDSTTYNNCNQFIVNNFNASLMTKKYENLYFSLLK